MCSEIPLFQVVQPVPDMTLNRHLFRDRLDYELMYDSRLPVEHGGHSSSSGSKPVIPVASWLLARLANVVKGLLESSVQFNEDQDAVVEFVGGRNGDFIGPIRLTIAAPVN